MKVYIPSYNRAGKVTTHEWFPDRSVIVIPESQYESYAKHYDPAMLKVIPDDKDGNVAKKRNAVLDIIAEEEGYGIIADDDLKVVKHIKRREPISREVLWQVFENLFTIARGIGAFYVGLNQTDDPLKYRGDFAPFSLTKPFYGVVGVIEDGIRYDESLTRGEDIDFYFRQLQKHHVVVRDNRYHPVFESKNKDTGIGKDDKECVEDFKRLQKRWGMHLIRLKPDGTVKGVSQPYKGV